MARVPIPATGTYDGRRFFLEDFDEFPKYEEFSTIRKTRSYYIYLADSGEVIYVKEDDPLLKFDPIRMED